MKACKECKSTENGFYCKAIKTCKKCQSKKQAIYQEGMAAERGFRNYYQFQKFNKFRQRRVISEQP